MRLVPGHLGPNGGPLEIRSGQILAMAVILRFRLAELFRRQDRRKRAGGGDRHQGRGDPGDRCGWAGIGHRAAAANYHRSIPVAGGFAGFFAALVAALWAYDGWNNVSMVASEIRNPARNLAGRADRRYCRGNRDLFTRKCRLFLCADAIRSRRQRSCRGGDDAPRAGDRAGAGAVSIAAMISIFAALNGSILSGSRVPYAMARDGLFFRPCRVRPPGLPHARRVDSRRSAPGRPCWF